MLQATTVGDIAFAAPAEEEFAGEEASKKKGVPYEQLTVGVVKETTPGERRYVCGLGCWICCGMERRARGLSVEDFGEDGGGGNICREG